MTINQTKKKQYKNLQTFLLEKIGLNFLSVINFTQFK